MHYRLQYHLTTPYLFTADLNHKLDYHNLSAMDFYVRLFSNLRYFSLESWIRSGAFHYQHEDNCRLRINQVLKVYLEVKRPFVSDNVFKVLLQEINVRIIPFFNNQYLSDIDDLSLRKYFNLLYQYSSNEKRLLLSFTIFKDIFLFSYRNHYSSFPSFFCKNSVQFLSCLNKPPERKRCFGSIGHNAIECIVITKFSSFYMVSEYYLKAETYTNRKYKCELRKHIYPSIGNVPIQFINPIIINKTLKNCQSQLSVTTYCVITRLIKRILHCAYYYGLIGKDITPYIFTVKDKTYDFIPYTKKEFARVIDAIGQSCLKSLYYVAGYTGILTGDLLKLNWSDYDASCKTLQVNGHKLNLSDNTKKIFDELYLMRTQDNYIFERSNGHKLTVYDLHVQAANIRYKADVGYFSLRYLRSNFLFYLLNNDYPLKDIHNYFWYKNTATITCRYYKTLDWRNHHELSAK